MTIDSINHVLIQYTHTRNRLLQCKQRSANLTLEPTQPKTILSEFTFMQIIEAIVINRHQLSTSYFSSSCLSFLIGKLES